MRPKQRWPSISMPRSTATRHLPSGSARRTTPGGTLGGRSEPGVAGSRQICGSASHKSRRWIMSELVPRDDVPEDEAALLGYLIDIVERGRHVAAVQVNTTLTMTYWLVGRAISVNTLRDGRADYGQRIVGSLSQQLTTRFGAGFDRSNLSRMM